MNEIGPTLKRARVARGLSLADIARVTRVPRATLDAIESGRQEELPAKVFLRGFIRAFALEVGEAPEPLLEALTDPASEVAPEPKAVVLRSLEPTQPMDDRFALILSEGISGSSRMRFGPAALVAVALAMFFAAWLMVGTRTSRGPQTAEPTIPALHQSHGYDAPSQQGPR